MVILDLHILERVVEPEDVLQLLHLTLVHVGSGPIDVPQSGRLEASPVFLSLHHGGRASGSGAIRIVAERAVRGERTVLDDF